MLANLDNPISQAEYHYQRFVIRKQRAPLIWIIMAILLLGPAMLTSIVYIGAIFLTLVSLETLTILQDYNSAFWVLVLVMTCSMYPVVTLVSFALSSNSIRREKFGKTWDNLRLTHMNNRQIILGKWWASFRALSGDHLMANVVRIGLFASIIGGAFGGPIEQEPAFYILNFVAFTLASIILTIFDVALTVSLGLMAAIFDEARGAIAMTLAAGLRFMASALAIAATFQAIYLYSTDQSYLHVIALALLLYAILNISVLWFCIKWMP
ncbi:hypothetical protein MASR2M15_21110 [Anaerolineales bacterium]